MSSKKKMGEKSWYLEPGFNIVGLWQHPTVKRGVRCKYEIDISDDEVKEEHVHKMPRDHVVAKESDDK